MAVRYDDEEANHNGGLVTFGAAVFAGEVLDTLPLWGVICLAVGVMALSFDRQTGDLYVGEVTYTFGVSRGDTPADCHTFQKFVRA